MVPTHPSSHASQGWSLWGSTSQHDTTPDTTEPEMAHMQQSPVHTFTHVEAPAAQGQHHLVHG